MVRVCHNRNQRPGSANLVPLLDFCLDRFTCEEIQALSAGGAKREGHSTEELPIYLPKMDREGLLVFPNPNDGLFTVLFTTSEKMEGKLTLQNLIGTTIFSDLGILPNSKLDLNLSEIPSGVYILRLQQQNKVFTQKIIIR
jgi:hypothetical protein